MEEAAAIPLSIHGTVSEELATILRRVPDTAQKLVDWIANEELLHPADVGGVTKEEEKVPALITALLDNQANLRIKHKSAVVRVWLMCRTAMSREEEIASGRVQQNSDAPSDQLVADPCHDLWAKSRAYRIFSCKLLIETPLWSIMSSTQNLVDCR